MNVRYEFLFECQIAHIALETIAGHAINYEFLVLKRHVGIISGFSEYLDSMNDCFLID